MSAVSKFSIGAPDSTLAAPAGHILIADDDPVTLKTVSRALERDGHSVSVAGDGPAALEAYRQMLPDLVLLDLVMPGLNGNQVCAAIRQQERANAGNVPVLILTGREDRDAVSDCFDAGATDFVTKPVNLRLLGERVRFALRASRTAADLRRAQTLARLGHWSLDLHSGAVMCSDLVSHLLEAQPGMALTLAEVSARLAPGERARLTAEIQSLFDRGYIDPTEFRLLTSTGEPRTVTTMGELLRDADGKAQSVFGVVQDVTEQKRLEQRVEFLDNYDGLTGLPNDILFSKRLAEAQFAHAGETRTPPAVLCVHMASLSEVALSFGARIGDSVLRTAGERIMDTVGANVTVSRRRTDYSILLPPGHNGTSPTILADRLLQALSHPVEVDGQTFFLAPTIGIARTDDRHRSPDAIQNDALAAAQRIDPTAENRIAFADADTARSSLRQLKMNTGLRRALDADQFRLVYQPQICLATGHLIGAEALLRWQASDLGNVGPAEFIPLLEGTELIHSVGRWVLEQALDQAACWRDRLPVVPRMSVNLSGKQLASDRLVTDIESAIARAGVEPGCLELEVTESVVMADRRAALDTLMGLKALGTRLALDDFGTGYSSLSQLQRLPFDVLKVDRTFVTGMLNNGDDETLVRSVIELAHNLGKEVVAEGVETRAHLQRLADLGCEFAQGYHIARPLEASQFEEFAAHYFATNH